MPTTRTDQVAVDGGAFDLHVWLPDVRDGPGVLLIQEIFGVGAYIRAVGERLAALGYVVGAPDVFWRIQPNWESDHTPQGSRPRSGWCRSSTSRRGWPTASPRSTPSRSCRRCRAAPASSASASAARSAYLTRRRRPARPAASATTARGSPAMLDQLDNIECPVLFHFGDADLYIPGDAGQRLEAAIEGGPSFSLNIEPAGHAFDNHEAPMFWNEAAAAPAGRRRRPSSPPPPGADRRRSGVGRALVARAERAVGRPAPDGVERRGAPRPPAGRRGPRGRAHEQPLLDEERLVDVLDRLGLLAHADGERRQADGTAAELLAQRAEDGPVDLVEPALVHAEQRQAVAGRGGDR